MPQIAHEPNALPIANPRQKGVHQDHLVNLGRVLRRIGVGHHQTDVMPNESDFFFAELLDKFVNVLCHGLLVVPTLWTFRVARPAQIGRDHRVIFASIGHHRRPYDSLVYPWSRTTAGPVPRFL
jgi:hypothetical protein